MRALTFTTTPARRAFKKTAGHTNHLLITTLVGLEGVATGAVSASPALRAAWNPQDANESAKRSRRFVRSATLAWVLQAFEEYLAQCADEANPFVPSGVIDSARGKPKLMERTRLFAEFAGQPQPQTSLTYLAILWRNRLIHGGGTTRGLPAFLVADLKRYADSIATNHRDLDVAAAIEHAKARQPPTLKEVTSLIVAIHDLVSAIDGALLREIDPDQVAEAILRIHYSAVRSSNGTCLPLRALWQRRNQDERARSFENILLVSGASDDASSDTSQHPKIAVSTLLNLAGVATAAEAEARLAPLTTAIPAAPAENSGAQGSPRVSI